MQKFNQELILKELKVNKTPVLLSGNSLGFEYQTQILGYQSGALKLVNKVHYSHITKFLQSTSFNLTANHFQFTASVCEHNGKDLILKIAKSKLMNETRQAQRIGFSENDQAHVEFINPIDKCTLIRKQIIDISSHGLSMLTAFESKLMCQDREFPKMKITVNGKEYATHNGKVVYVKKFFNLTGQLHLHIGIKFI